MTNDRDHRSQNYHIPECGSLHEFVLQVLILESKVRLYSLAPTLRAIFMYGMEVEVDVGAHFVCICRQFGFIVSLKPCVVLLMKPP
eukprot:scaffold742_cov395-Prasinococcus_capsulatus_cf.AAC.4